MTEFPERGVDAGREAHRRFVIRAVASELVERSGAGA
jgi:hypothetical protein